MVHIFIKNAYPLTVMILENKYIIIFVDLVQLINYFINQPINQWTNPPFSLVQLESVRKHAYGP